MSQLNGLFYRCLLELTPQKSAFSKLVSERFLSMSTLKMPLSISKFRIAMAYNRGLVLATLTTLALTFPARAVTVSPKGVNVRTFGPSTIFLTFIGIRSDQSPAEGLWCGDINANQSCRSGTVFGRLPSSSNLANRSGPNGQNLTDIMTIPPSIARRAYQDALRGNSSEFFYVRRFVSANGPDEFVAVTCRLAGGGARTPLALTNVKLEFTTSSAKTVTVIPRNAEVPPIQAQIRYNGTGLLKGRWEVVLPGEPPPSARDRLPEASLPIEQRGTQRRYTLVERFSRFVPPTGRVTWPGPDPARFPKNASGLHIVLLRLEATADREGNSATGFGTVNSGGVAGFPLPVLRYYVSAKDEGPSLALLAPKTEDTLIRQQAVTFEWQPLPTAQFYRLDVVRLDGSEVLSAITTTDEPRYIMTPDVIQDMDSTLRWRVKALDAEGNILNTSEWNTLNISNYL